jgi:GMP synthase (glutamine-hydrolysing)
MNGRVLIIVHGDRSTPGRVGRQLRELGYTLDRCQPSCGDPLPATMDDHVGAVVFGGPMSANDDNLDFIRAEMDWIPTALESGKPFLGICLGAQILARVMGAKVEAHPAELAEIGYYPVRPLPAGAHLFDREALFYQWHQEGFELPHGATPLATAEAFENQAFHYANAYGIQFHPEVTGKIMRTWTTVAAHRLSAPGAQSQAEQISRQPTSERHVRGWLRRFLGVWLNGSPDTDSAKLFGNPL